MTQEFTQQLQRLRIALRETQEELSALKASVPWLVGALRHIAQGNCAYNMTEEIAEHDNCACYPCTARGALKRFNALRPIPR